MGDSGDFVFKSDPATGGIGYVGDFEGLYRAMDDPWGQSGEHPRMKGYYAYSRACLECALLDLILPDYGKGWQRALEVGCGTGYVVDRLEKRFLHSRVIHGCDISATAVARAFELHPNRFFYQMDITDPTAKIRPRWGGAEVCYDVVILSQILWYVLENLPTTLHNCGKLLSPNGHLIIQTAFLDEQKFGKAIIDGWHGLLRWVINTAPAWRIVSASYDATDRHAPHHDGILVLQKES